jgi:tetratricopeptide (TPR) repeat protein
MSAVSWQQGLELLKQGKAQEAEQVLRQVTTTDALSFEGNFYLGVALAQQGRYQEAVAPLSTAVNIDPNHAGAHYNLGLALQHAGDTHRAMGEYEAALAIKPDYAKASQTLQSLKSQQAAPARPQPVMPQPGAPGAWQSSQSEEPVYSEEQLREADRAEKVQQFFVRGACMVAWGIGLAALFFEFSKVMSILFGIIIIAPILAPLIYLVALDGREWLSVNPKLAIPISIVGIVFSIPVTIWFFSRGGFSD